jgi:hypothetical protein
VSGCDHVVTRGFAYGDRVPAPSDFAYALLADGRVRISHRGRQVVTLAGARAATFARRVAEADGEGERQLLMARMTGNFKRGNERLARERSRRV